MWQKIKDAFKRYWKWIVGGLGAISALILLGRTNRNVSTYDELKKGQAEREKEAEKVVENAEKVKENTDQLIEDYYKRKNERRK